MLTAFAFVRALNILYWEKGMDIRSTEVSKGFVYLHFKEKGYGLFINQFEAFGSLLLKAGSNVRYEAETASIMYKRDGKERQIHLAQLSFMQARTEKIPHVRLESVITDSDTSFDTQSPPFNINEQWPHLLQLSLFDVTSIFEYQQYISHTFRDYESVVNVPFELRWSSGFKRVKVQGDDLATSRPNNHTPDQACNIALSDISGIHPKVKQFLLRNSAMGRELLPLTRNEVLDYLTLFPIILVQDDGKLYCVAGIQSYLYAVSVLDKKQTVPVRWYKERMGKALHRLNMMESLGLPIIFSTKKCLLQQTFETLQPSFGPLYKQSFLASCSVKHFATLFGLDTRTIQEGGR
ncbi:MAG: hypothetical protein ACTIMS_10670 [Marinomonas sp.]